MQFTSVLLAAAAFTGFANAVQFTNLVFNNVTAGEPFTFTWSNATGPVEITLKNGNRDALKDVQTVTSGQTGTSYTWNVPASLPADTYAFEISDGGKPNYSIQFQLIGGASSSSSATATAPSNSTGTSTSTSTPTGASNSTTTRGSTTRTSTPSATDSGTGGGATETSAPDAGGMAAGFTSNLAFVFLVVGALMTLN